MTSEFWIEVVSHTERRRKLLYFVDRAAMLKAAPRVQSVMAGWVVVATSDRKTPPSAFALEALFSASPEVSA